MKGERKNEPSKSETLYRKAAEDEIELSLFSESDNDYVSSYKGEPNDRGNGMGKGDGPQGKNKPKIKGGKSKNGSETKGGKSPKHPIKARVFHFDEKDGRNIYKSIIHSDNDLGTIELGLAQYADSGQDIAFQLHSVKDVDGIEMKFTEIKDLDGIVSEYKIITNTKKGKNVFFLEISDNQKSAFLITT